MQTELDKLLEKSIGALSISLDTAVRSALCNYEALELKDKKGELSHIYISFLLSSVLCKLPLLRIDLLDANGRNDMTECCIDWDVARFSDNLYRDANESAKQIERIKEYELEKLWLDAAKEYFQALEKYMPSIIEGCSVVHELKCQWHFGQFLGSTTIVRESDKDEIL